MKLEIINVSKSYGKNKVLSEVNLSADIGTCVGIIGKNGSGKSTLFSVLTGITKREKGDFLYCGESLFSNPQKLREYIGFVPQNPPLIEELSAYDNLRLWYKKDALEKALDQGALKMLGVDKFIKTTVNKMSGGMKKRLAISCIAAHDPKILILDEPSASLDIEGKERIAEYVSGFNKNGGTVLLATHEVSEIERCDKIYLLREGKAEDFYYCKENLSRVFI